MPRRSDHGWFGPLGELVNILTAVVALSGFVTLGYVAAWLVATR